MEAQYYSDKSIKVSGNTKPWSTYLTQLGGKWNPNLQGGGGWIFSKNKEAELVAFIAKANAGTIAPVPAIQAVKAPAPAPASRILPSLTSTLPMPLSLAPKTLPAMTPDEALSRLKQPPTLPKPVAPLAPLAATANYPNRFTAADNLTYQIIILTVPEPQLNQNFEFSYTQDLEKNTITGKVSAILHSNPVDSVELKVPGPEGEEATIYHGILAAGIWKIQEYLSDFDLKQELKFLPMA